MGKRLRCVGALVPAGAVVLALSGCTPLPVVSMADGSAREGELIAFATTLVADGAGNPNTATGDVHLYCTTENGSAVAGADYVGLADQLCGTIRAGSRTTTVHVRAMVDSEWEAHEDFTLRYRVVGPAKAGRGYASGQIT